MTAPKDTENAPVELPSRSVQPETIEVLVDDESLRLAELASGLDAGDRRWLAAFVAGVARIERERGEAEALNFVDSVRRQWRQLRQRH